MATSREKNQAENVRERRKAAPPEPVASPAPAAPRRKATAGAKTIKTSPAPEKAAATKAAVAKADEPPPKKELAEKRKKLKLVRDSFAMPATEYDLIAQLKKRCLDKGIVVKKSEVLRAAVASFAALSDAAVSTAVAGLQPIKTGRPPKPAK